MIYEYSRATRADEAVLGLSDLFTISLQNDDVQDFAVGWDHALLSVSEMPSDALLEGLYKSKLQNFAQLRTVFALHDQETARNEGKLNYSQLKTAVKIHLDQMMRTSKLQGFGTMLWNEDRSPRVKRKESPRWEESEECFQWKAHGQCSTGGSCSFSHDTIASGNSGEGQR